MQIEIKSQCINNPWEPHTVESDDTIFVSSKFIVVYIRSIAKLSHVAL